jgi:hypothetical protein
VRIGTLIGEARLSTWFFAGNPQYYTGKQFGSTTVIFESNVYGLWKSSRWVASRVTIDFGFKLQV